MHLTTRGERGSFRAAASFAALSALVLAPFLAPSAAVSAEQSTREISGVVALPDNASAFLGNVIVRAQSVDVQPPVTRDVRVNGETGAYRVTGLPSGQYRVQFYAPPPVLDEYFDDSRSAEGAALVDVTGADRAGVSAELSLPAVISGTVALPAGLGAASVVVTDRTGLDLSAPVELSPSGAFTIRGLYKGDYRVRLQTTIEGQPVAQYLTSADARLFPVGAAERKTLSLTVRPMTASLTGTGTAENFNGYDSTLDRLADVVIREQIGDDWVRHPAVTSLRANGTTPFTARGLNEGTYTVGFEAPPTPYVANGEIAYQWYRGSQTLADATPVVLADGETRTDINGYVRPVAAIPGFRDVPVTSEFFKEIRWMATEGLSTGYVSPNGAREYRPFQSVSREAVAAFFYRLAGSPDFEPPAVSPFLDDQPGDPFYKEITWMHAQGLATGWQYPDGVRFLGHTYITRDAMAAFFYRYAGSPQFTPPGDAAGLVRPEDPFYTEISWLVTERIATGIRVYDGSLSYAPWGLVTRDAMAAFLYRYDERFGED